MHRPLNQNTKKARIRIFTDKEEWKPALAAAIDPRQLPPEYGGSAPALANTPYLSAVHSALKREDAGDSGYAAVNGVHLGGKATIEAPQPGDGADVSEPMSCLLRWFSLRGGSERYEGNGGVDGVGGGGRDGGACGGAKSGGAVGGGNGIDIAPMAGMPLAAMSKAEEDRSPDEGAGLEQKDDDDALRDNKQTGFSNNVFADTAAPLGQEEAAAGGGALAAGVPAAVAGGGGGQEAGGGRSSSSQLIRDAGKEERDANDFGWVLRAVPGARVAAKMTGAVVGAALRTTFGAAGLAATCAEAVVPGHIWTEAVESFEEWQVFVRWAIGMKRFEGRSSRSPPTGAG